MAQRSSVGGGVRVQRGIRRGALHAAAAALALAGIGKPALASRARDLFGICARCHPSKARRFVETGGHVAPEFGCTPCHEDRRRTRVGHRHRRIPQCTSHHLEAAHPVTALRPRHPRGTTKQCLKCHNPHGSSNLDLIRNRVRAPHRRRPRITFISEGGRQPGSFADPDRPGKGLCEVCHTATIHYRKDGGGAPHFTVRCTLCHDHTKSFVPAISDKNCFVCHEEEANDFTKPSAHSANFACSGCHSERSPSPGAGHRQVPQCSECHDDKTHAPPGVQAFDCTRCHDPHGSDNSDLVKEHITDPAGASHSVVFNSDEGRADGSFASESSPGSGICEICHTATLYYRADGSGQGHFTTSCIACHAHTDGFEPSS